MANTTTSSQRRQAIEARAIQLGIKWAPLARQLGLSVSFLTQIRNGQRNPSPVTAYKLESALGWEHGSIERLDAGKQPIVKQHGPETPADRDREAMRERMRIVAKNEHKSLLRVVLEELEYLEGDD